MKEAKLYVRKKGNNVQCLACPHKCLISEDNFGICGVRKNVKGKLFLLVYGKPVAVHVDPIEKKPFYNFLPGTYSYSIGTFGCNFRCSFCQNYDISQFREFYLDFEETIKKLPYVSPNEIVKNALNENCSSIAYTYNEPSIFVEYVRDIAVLARKEGLKNLLVTNGYFSKESFEYVSKYIDAMNVDLKSFRDEFYQKICGAKLKPVLETIKRAYEKGIHLELTTLIIPEENDSDDELKSIAEFIASIDKNIPWHISRFFPMYKMQDEPITPFKTLKRAKKIGRSVGLKYVYIGNV